jgi:hypothetical protein
MIYLFSFQSNNEMRREVLKLVFRYFIREIPTRRESGNDRLIKQGGNRCRYLRIVVLAARFYALHLFQV